MKKYFDYSPNELWRMLGAEVKKEPNKRGDYILRAIYLDGECILFNAGYRLELVVASILNGVEVN